MTFLANFALISGERLHATFCSFSHCLVKTLAYGQVVLARFYELTELLSVRSLVDKCV